MTSRGPSVSYLLADQERMGRALNYFQWQYRLAAKYLGRRILEVGCGAGNFTRFLLDRELVVAVDTEPACIAKVRERFPARSNLLLECCGPPEAEFIRLARFEPDSCVCFNVLEHIREDREAVDAMASILQPGGTLLLFAPAFEALYGPIDAALGHYRRYTRKELVKLARRAGLEKIESRYVNLPGMFAWWIDARLFRREIQSRAQIAFFDRFIAPVESRLEAAFPPPAGLSIFAAFRKRAE